MDYLATLWTLAAFLGIRNRYWIIIIIVIIVILAVAFLARGRGGGRAY